MAGEFAETDLGNLLSFANGRSSPPRTDALPYPVYGSNGIIGYANETNTAAGSIVIGRVGSYCGSLYFSNQKCWVTDNAIRAIALGDNDPRFLFYLLGTLHLNSWRAGSGQPLLNQEILSRIPAAAPDPPEQRAIAHILGTLDDKIELNRRISETLEAMARALFKSWFVDFDPVRAKAEGRDPGLPQSLTDLFPDSFEESEMGEIPSGWRVQSLADLAHFTNGLALQRFPPVGEQALPVIKIAQLRAGHTRGAQSASADLPASYVVVDGDVLFSWSGSLECVLWGGGRGALNQHLFKVSPKGSPTWLYYFWIHEHLAEFRRIAASKATTMGHIQRHHLTSAQVVIPTSALIEAATAHLGPLVGAIPKLLVQSRTLGALRDELLPRLVSGSLRVAQAETFVKAIE